MTNSPVPANSLTPCPFGGNPKVAAQMGIPSCGIARPGPFFNSLNLGKPTSGGRKSRRSRRGGRRSRRGGVDTLPAPNENQALDVENKPNALPVMESKPDVPVKCPPGCGKKNFLHSIFGTGGRKSRRRGGKKCGSHKKMYGGRKSRRRGGKNCGSHKKMYGGRKSRRRGRKSRKHNKKTKMRRAGNDLPETPSTPATVQHRPPSPPPQYQSTSASYGFPLNDYGTMTGRGGRR